MAGASDKSKSFESILTKVEKCAECPVCLETAKVPFKLCSRGHIICLSCTTKLSKCPTCEGPFILENPVCLKNILEALPRRCIYSQDGCEEIVEPGNDHEKFCGYRPIVCRGFDCSVKVPVLKIMDHYKEHHEDALYITERYVEGLDLFSPLFLMAHIPVWVFDNLFWFLLFYDQATDAYKVYFLATPIGKLDHDNYVRFTIENGDFLVANTLKAAVISRENELAVTDLSRREILLQWTGDYDKFCMIIPRWQLNDWNSYKYKTNLVFLIRKKVEGIIIE